MKSLRILSFLLLATGTLLAQNKKYTGKYVVENGPFSTILIYEQNGKLMGEAVGQGTSELVPGDDENTFDVMEVSGASVEFMKEGAIVTSLKLLIDGQAMTGKRKFPELTDYPGTYTFTEAPVSKVVVSVKDNSLQISTPEFGSSDLQFKGHIDEFFESNYESDFIFKRNDKNQVTGLSISVPSQNINLDGVKSTDLSVYTGKYEIRDYGVSITIGLKDGRLFVNSDQGDSFLNAGERPNTFSTENGVASLEFVFDADPAVEKINVSYQGQPLTAHPVK